MSYCPICHTGTKWCCHRHSEAIHNVRATFSTPCTYSPSWARHKARMQVYAYLIPCFPYYFSFPYLICRSASNRELIASTLTIWKYRVDQIIELRAGSSTWLILMFKITTWLHYCSASERREWIAALAIHVRTVYIPEYTHVKYIMPHTWKQPFFVWTISSVNLLQLRP